MSKKDVEEYCRRIGLKTSGNKPELVYRAVRNEYHLIKKQMKMDELKQDPLKLKRYYNASVIVQLFKRDARRLCNKGKHSPYTKEFELQINNKT